MAININFVRNATLFILNKSNLGYLGVSEFNTFCTLAQQDIFENLFFQYNQFINRQNKRLTGSEYADLPKNLREQIDVFAEYTTQANFTYNSGTNLWSYSGSDLYRAENLSLVQISNNKKIDIEEVSKRRLNVMNNSDLTKPSLIFPVYEKISNSFRVYPIAPSTHFVEMFYLRSPKAPKWTFTMVQGNPIYNASATDLQHIELHPSLLIPFLTKVLAYAGLSIREPEVEQYANSEEMKKINTQV